MKNPVGVFDDYWGSYRFLGHQPAQSTSANLRKTSAIANIPGAEVSGVAMTAMNATAILHFRNVSASCRSADDKPRVDIRYATSVAVAKLAKAIR